MTTAQKPLGSRRTRAPSRDGLPCGHCPGPMSTTHSIRARIPQPHTSGKGQRGFHPLLHHHLPLTILPEVLPRSTDHMASSTALLVEKSLHPVRPPCTSCTGYRRQSTYPSVTVWHPIALSPLRIPTTPRSILVTCSALSRRVSTCECSRRSGGCASICTTTSSVPGQAAFYRMCKTLALDRSHCLPSNGSTCSKAPFSSTVCV
jgi:hypothetical protein